MPSAEELLGTLLQHKDNHIFRGLATLAADGTLCLILYVSASMAPPLGIMTRNPLIFPNAAHSTLPSLQTAAETLQQLLLKTYSRDWQPAAH